MHSLLDYFSMNGYGFYIWASYLFTFTLIGILVLSVISRKRIIEKKLGKLNKINNSENKQQD